MNQQEQIKEQPPLDPVTGQPTPREPEAPAPRTSRSGWPLLIILVAAVVLALIAWLPAELTGDGENEPAPAPSTATTPADEPAPTDQATPPAGGATPPAPTAPAQPQSQPAQ
ncbi:hypothetical protein [Sinorhizobium saheli]|uniref:Uncharacterized protein n=1 Tax=Sinorhizobium saheli TaxID=36856 RepID=A0A178YBU0_SINSA|nr:hypothetical protein [Sinorhizobium saheli]MQW89199.1 hypothetical protein [Sinorhizobium saheli]OAP44938.1 hypothetical protein ATB98_19045 [Sinorhizobium saheli]